MENILKKIAEKERECSLAISKAAGEEQHRLELFRSEMEKKKIKIVHEIRTTAENSYRNEIKNLEDSATEQINRIKEKGYIPGQDEEFREKMKAEIIKILFS